MTTTFHIVLVPSNKNGQGAQQNDYQWVNDKGGGAVAAICFTKTVESRVALSCIGPVTTSLR